MFLSQILIDSRMIINYILEENTFCRYRLHAFVKEEILKHHIKYSFQINGKQRIKMSKKSKYFKFKNFERKIKLPFIIYVVFESILVPEDDKFSRPFKSYLGEDSVYNFINSIME